MRLPLGRGGRAGARAGQEEEEEGGRRTSAAKRTRPSCLLVLEQAEGTLRLCVGEEDRRR